GVAVGAGHAPAVLQAVFDHGDVLEADGPALAVGDDEVAEGLEVHGLALRTHVHLALGRLDAPGRHFLVLALDGRGHVLHGQALRLQARGVEPDADGPLAVAAELDLAHAFDGLELGLEDVADVVGHERGRPIARQRDPEDGLVLGVLLGDDRGIHLAREAARRLRHLRLHVLEGDVDVPGEVELDVDAGRALARRGGDLLDAFDRGDRVLDEVDDVRLHDLGRRALVGERDVDDREVDVGVLAHAQATHDPAESGEADEAEAHEAGHEHPREHVVADGDVGEGGPRRDLVGVFFLGDVARRLRFAHHWAWAAPAEAREDAGAPAGAVWTSMPSARRSEPSTTSFSP